MPKLTKRCAQCNKPFQVYPAYYERRQYCNRKCKARAQGHPPVSGTCDYCGAQITGRRYASWIKKKHHFCSRECHNAYRRKSPAESKPGSHAWKRYARTIRNEVDNICVFCARSNQEHKRRVVHHIIPYSESKDNSRNNLCCLCHYCHMAVESMCRFDRSTYLGFMAPFLRARQTHFRELKHN